MPCNYEAIRQYNIIEYGKAISRIGQMLLADRYDDRTHFIYELLQNAEDALARRVGWQGPRVVKFDLNAERLRVSHFGVPFDEKDVLGICGIGESTKDLTEIGRFGIGFKSVYAFSDRPEIHSGSENFAIESYVRPVAVEPVEREKEETVVLIPLKADGGKSKLEIADGLSRLEASSLLFLREIDEIHWNVDGGVAGFYLRQAKDRGPNVRSVTIVGQKDGESEVNEEWLVCSREVYASDRQPVGHVEVAWSVAKDENQCEAIRSVERSRLVVFFPTVVETNLGFLVQGPYRTTPSRDNVPWGDEWNRACIRETAILLVDSLRWLRDQGLLDATALECLPLDSGKFEESMFRELYEATKDALTQEDLLPAFGGGHVSAANGWLARTQELRQLLDSTQLKELEDGTRPLRWVDGQVSQDKTPALRKYLIWVLDMRELTPESLLPRLNQDFLERQSDGWIEGLYEFFGSQGALHLRLGSLPIIRLADGSHVAPSLDGEIQAFLPGPVETDFPTVREAVCRSEGARKFLGSLNLTEADPVDNVIRNVLPKYQGTELNVSEAEYALDIEHILAAATTDSQSQRNKLLRALRSTPWVKAVDVGRGLELMARPEDVYVATDRLRKLFADIKGVLIVDSRVACLRGEAIRELLERSGASRYLQPVEVRCDLLAWQLSEIRRKEGLERYTWSEIKDVSVRGLDMLLERLPALESEERARRAANLWGALCDLHDRRGAGTFDGTYKWSFHRETKEATFDAAFVRVLNEERWIPDSSGALREPASITFDKVGWHPNGFLESKIRFKPPLVERLAQEVGIEPGVIDLLRRLGVTSEAELRQRLDLEVEPSAESAIGVGHSEADEGISPTETGDRDTEPLIDRDEDDKPRPGEEIGGAIEETRPRRGNEGSKEKMPRESQFKSYVGVVGEETNSDPDGLKHARRMELEGSAIEFILSSEPDWQRTPLNNPGFDLYRGTAMEAATEWCEVKAMTGSLKDRPVGMSRVQFEWARKHGETYWLYVVEHAESNDARVVRIQDPAGKAMTFTFDDGWRTVAVVDTSPEAHS